MSLSQIRTVNFGKTRTGLEGSVGYTILNYLGGIVVSRTTASIYEVATGSGMYSSLLTFPDSFKGTVVWDSGQVGASKVFATEEYNYEANNPNVDVILSQSSFVSSSIIELSSSVSSISSQTLFMSSSLVELSSSIGRVECKVNFLKNMEGGRWKIDTTVDQMIFYAEDNVTEVARFDLYDVTGSSTSECVYERVRTGPITSCP
jgi:hypothetical protein